jgi:cholesterol transport system auxiliary component
MTHRSSKACFGVTACSLLIGCALLSKQDPLVPRYFTPEDRVPAQPAIARVAAAETRQLRLGSVSGSSQLRERIMFRNSAHELVYYDDLRWTEPPEVYLRRALARALFGDHSLVRVVSGSAPTLDVELVAFEEIRTPHRAGRVQVIMTLDDDRLGMLQQTITIEQAVRADAGGSSPEPIVDALARALQSCVAQIVDRVLVTLPNAAQPRPADPVAAAVDAPRP